MVAETIGEVMGFTIFFGMVIMPMSAMIVGNIIAMFTL